METKNKKLRQTVVLKNTHCVRMPKKWSRVEKFFYVQFSQLTCDSLMT